MDTLVNITNLELGANRIRVIENLDNLVNLTQLWLGKNKITKLEVMIYIFETKNLHEIHALYNRI